MTPLGHTALVRLNFFIGGGLARFSLPGRLRARCVHGRGCCLSGAHIIGKHVIAGQELLFQVERELVFLSLQDDIASVEQLDLGGALKSTATYLRDLS